MAYKTIKVLSTPESLSKNYYTIADLEKIFALKKASLLVSLSRLVKRGEIIRLRKGLYHHVTLMALADAFTLYIWTSR